MASIRHNLQKELFDFSEEKLIDILNVTKAGKKKKKTSFLCAAVTKEKPVSTFIYQVKKTEKDCFQKKNSWSLLELQVVDGKDSNQETAELDLTFTHVYKWLASSVPEKYTFIHVLWKLCYWYLPKQKPLFINVPPDLIKEETSGVGKSVVIIPGLEPVDSMGEADFCALSDREQHDLEQLMIQTKSAVSDAESFAEKLSSDLTMLDGANIHSMMASEAQVKALMEMIDSALSEATKIENRLKNYDEILAFVKGSIDKMAEKNIFIEQLNTNNRQLLENVTNVIQCLEYPSKYADCLRNPHFERHNLMPIIEAANALEIAITAPIPPHLCNLQAVKEQRKRFEKLKVEFTKHLAHNLNNLFIYHSNDPVESTGHSFERLTLPHHSLIHEELMPYAPLMHWMHNLDPKSFKKLKNTYAGAMSKLYERDIKNFFDEAKNYITGGRKLRGNETGQDTGGKLTAGPLLGLDMEQWSGEVDVLERQRFDQIFDQMLNEMEPICLGEQKFCISFFNLDAFSDERVVPRSLASTPGTNSSEDSGTSVSYLPKQVNKQVRLMMSEMFSNLEQNLTSFINTFYRIDSYCCLYVYVRLSEHVLSAEDTGSFLSITFGSCLVHAKRNYDSFMNSQIISIRECKISKKKCGILPFITNFESFAKITRDIFRGSDRQSDLDKWYTAVIGTINDNIPRVAAEHQRTPPEVIKMENFRALHQLLSQLKLPCLETQRKEAKQRYQEALKAYVTEYFGRPLEKLNQFFDGITSKVASGVKESEIGYQLAFSKQELRKVIKEYPGKEVKKGLEQLYKKVEKHLSEEGNLLQVVWRAMQEEFIEQYKYLEDMIHRCYPGAMVSLEFSIEDILTYFSDIAFSH